MTKTNNNTMKARTIRIKIRISSTMEMVVTKSSTTIKTNKTTISNTKMMEELMEDMAINMMSSRITER